jgi:hypothetical protein
MKILPKNVSVNFSAPTKFHKIDPCKNFEPILESRPIARATSEMSAPVDSQISDMALMLEILCARKALAASLESSEDHVFIVMIRSGADLMNQFRPEITFTEFTEFMGIYDNQDPRGANPMTLSYNAWRVFRIIFLC